MLGDCAPGRARQKCDISQLHQGPYRDPSDGEVGGERLAGELRELLKGLYKQNKTKNASDKNALNHHTMNGAGFLLVQEFSILTTHWLHLRSLGFFNTDKK